MRTYLDTSAVVKLLVDEPESEGLASYLSDVPADGVFSSALLEPETRRAAARTGVDQAAVTEVLASVSLVDMTRPLLHAAGLLPDPSLRTLDAIHLQTAIELDADVMVTYDLRLRAAAEDRGIPTTSPA